MSCVISEGAVMRLKKAKDRKYACLRLAKKAGVSGKLRRALACGNQEYGSVEIFHIVGGGMTVKHCGGVVYSKTRGKVTTCKFDQVWVDALDRIIVRVEGQQRHVKVVNAKHLLKARSLESRFAIV